MGNSVVLRKPIFRFPHSFGSAEAVATTPFDLPESGALVSLSSRSRERIRGRVVSSDRNRIFVELERDHVAFRRRARLELEWIDPLGLVRRRGRLVSASPGGAPTVEIEFGEPPNLIQRREELRVAITLKATAWSFHAWTRLLEGETLDLSETGALLHLPKLPPATTRIELRLALPDRPLGLTARVVRRGDADTVAVAFEALAASGRERLRDVLSPQLFRQGRSALAA